MDFLLAAFNFDPLSTLSTIVPDVVKCYQTDEESENYKKWKTCANALKMSLEVLSNIVISVTQDEPHNFIDFIKKSDLLNKVLGLCDKLAKPVNPIMNSTPALMTDLNLVTTIFNRALACAENIILGLDSKSM